MYESEQIYPLEVANRAEQFAMRMDPRHTRIICRKEDLSLSKLLGLSLVIRKQSESNIDFFARSSDLTSPHFLLLNRRCELVK